jgi:hypothetical protein
VARSSRSSLSALLRARSVARTARSRLSGYEELAVGPETGEIVMPFQAHHIYDHFLLTALVLSGGEHVVEGQPDDAVSFLLDPGGQDYVGINSYDSSRPGVSTEPVYQSI